MSALGRGLCTLVAVSAVGLAGCTGTDGEPPAAAAEDVTVYTCASDEVVQPIIAAFEAAHDGVSVDLFRAPTGELNARVAADLRSGGLRADVVWACDPLTMQALADQDLVGGWVPDDVAGIPEAFRTEDSVGAHVLYVVAVHHTGTPAPRSWRDLADGGSRVALPDPAFAASALGALGYFAGADGFGLAFYEDLHSAGAAQVSSPDEVTVGVAEGTYDAGITIATSAYQAQEDGSPVDVVWPEPGAVAVHGPIALARDSADSASAKDFVSFVVGPEGQALVGASGGYPAREGVEGPTVPDDAPVVVPDWAALAQQRDDLLAAYQKIFGG